MSRRRVLSIVVAATGLLALPSAAGAAFDPVYEAKNFSKITERFAHITGTLGYQAELRIKNLAREAQVLQIIANDRERVLEGQLCWNKSDGCAGDTRLYDWVTRGAGIALPVAWTARNGSTISGHLWATAQGPAKRPAIVLTNGSVQAPEELYWASAQALAKAGYVVLTWDPQGQGFSDTIGEGADLLDGVPSQEGRPFYDGTEDALDFLLSTPSSPYVPRKSCTSGTSHAAKQERRVKAGLASAYDPLAGLIDASRIGLVGHSLGAGAVSYVGQIDPRVDAIVAYDNLSAGGTAPKPCASGSAPRPAPPLAKPALGISNDYGLTPQPNTGEVDPDAKVTGSTRLSGAGVDSMEVVIRGGTHYESSFIPNPAFGGTLRGYDLVSWYTVAWLDKYVKGDRTADARILTDRWRADAQEAAVDPDKDGNLFSRLYRSRVQLRTTDGREVRCESLRDAKDCPALAPDGEAKDYDVVALDQAKEASPNGPGREAAKPWTITTDPAGATGAPPAANRYADPQPAAGSGAATACADRTRPSSRVDRAALRVTRRGVRARGTASDRGCGGARGRVTRVQVAVAKVERGRCRDVRRDGTLAPKRTSCTRPRWLTARGTTRWTFSTPARLPRGSYRVRVRAVDATANVGRAATTAVRAR